MKLARSAFADTVFWKEMRNFFLAFPVFGPVVLIWID
jgi:hypothetical protein